MLKMTRRSFLSKSGKNVLYGTALGSFAVSSGKSPHIVGSNERLQLALIGCGGRGYFLARGFIEDGAEISFVCDPHPARMDKVAQQLSELQNRKLKKVKHMQNAFSSKDVDAVIISTPDHWHALATIWACQAEKDVYLEKPQSHNIWEGRKMIEAAQKYNCIVQVGAQNRSAPYNFAAREYIQSGKLGNIHLVKVYNMKSNASFHRREEPFILGDPGTPPEGFDWDLWLGSVPYRPFHQRLISRYGWNAFWEFSVGDMNDGIHQLDLAMMLMGEPPMPKAVSCSGGRFQFPNDDAEVPDTQVCIYDFDNFIMTFELTGYPQYMRKTSSTIRRNDQFPYWTQNATRIELYGSKELMIVGRMGGGWITMTSGGKVVEKIYGRIPDDAHRHDFIECIKYRKNPNGDIEIVNKSNNLAHLGNIAYRIGNKKLWFDSNTERFIKNEEANKMVKRKYRNKYKVPEII